jgi:hypothetical protein
MSDHDAGPPGWVDRIRHWLWLDRTQRTDNREANRGFYPGGPPVYVNRKPVGRRFVLVVGAIAIAIGLVILTVRETEAGSCVPIDPTPVTASIVLADGRRGLG